MSTKEKQISLMSLFQVGAHRGNKKSKLNPRLKKYIYGVNRGLSIINLVDTKKAIENSEELMKKVGRKHKQVLIVGTSKHLIDLLPKFASQFGEKQMPYVNHRWLGGTLTNWATIRKTLKSLEKTRNIISDDKFFNSLSKNEQLNLQKKLIKLEKFFGGLDSLKNNRPGAVIVLDTHNNAVAVEEANTLGIPVISLTNINAKSLPVNLDHTIVCNVSSTNTIELIIDRLGESYIEGSKVQVEVKEEDKK